MTWLADEANRYEQRQNNVDTDEPISLDRSTPATEPEIDPPDIGGQSEWSD